MQYIVAYSTVCVVHVILATSSCINEKIYILLCYNSCKVQHLQWEVSQVINTISIGDSVQRAHVCNVPVIVKTVVIH